MREEESRVLEALVLEEDLDALFELVSLDDIAAAWCRYHNVTHPSDADDPDWWAVHLFFTTEIFRRREVYRSLLLKLVHHADAPMLGQIGAGPLENFVSDDPDDLHWLESHCATNPKLRTGLAGVWCSNDVSADTLARLDKAAGTPLARLAPPR